MDGLNENDENVRRIEGRKLNCGEDGQIDVCFFFQAEDGIRDTEL